MSRTKLPPGQKRKPITVKLRPDLIAWMQDQKPVTGESQGKLIEQALDRLIESR